LSFYYWENNLLGNYASDKLSFWKIYLLGNFLLGKTPLGIILKEITSGKLPNTEIEGHNKFF